MRIWFKAIFITASIAAVILLFDTYWFVDNKEQANEISTNSIINKAIPEVESIKLLKDSLFVSISSENYSNFALRLSSSYAYLGNYDSAASYKELIANRFPNEENWENAGLMYYKAFKNASGETQEKQMANKAIACFEKTDFSKATIEVKLALANLYLSVDEPRKATRLLQEVLATDNNNREALYRLGIQNFQIEDFESAEVYLTHLIAVDSSHINGLYYLALVQLKVGNRNKAKVLFNKLKLLGISAEVEADVDVYLNDIK